MALRIESLAEPLPGYRLIERLGGGGFGEVWKAEAPGGLFKAIKFVYGDLEAADEEGARAGQEFKALKRVITVRHPFILSLERFDVIDGRLMIVTELADKTLWDRFRECRTEGLPGIPREELLGYLHDAAEALDLMNTEYQLQHLDIKPQNLFLVHTHVKVADFGLVKDLEGMMASVTGGVTPVYAAPETFEGKVSRFSDQYSLAIVFQELLTGQRPYTGTTLRQLVMQHCQGTPDLKPLPEADRPIVLRALAKHHEDRYPNCNDFIEELRHAGQPEPVYKPVPQLVPALDSDKTNSGTAYLETGDAGADQTSQPMTRRPGPAPGVVAAPAPARPSDHGKASDSSPDDFAAPSTSFRPQSAGPADAVLVPALAIGLGQFGLGTLRQLRKEIIENFGSAGALPSLRLLYIDTDPETVQVATRGKSQLALLQHEVLLTRLHRPSYYIKPRDTQTGLESWLHPRMLYRIPRQQTAAGIRALGRLAFVDNYRTIARRLRTELEDCCTPEALDKAARETGLNVYTPVPRVYIVSSLAGGTGSGMFIDLAYLVRQQLAQLGHDSAEVVGIFFLPPADREPRRTPQLANAFAALTELNHFSAPHSVFSACYELGEVRVSDPVIHCKGPPLGRCRFFSLPEVPTANNADDNHASVFAPTLERTLGTAAHVIFNELATPLGRVADEMRHPNEPCTEQGVRTCGQRAKDSEPTLFQLAGMYRIVWPRRQLLNQAAAAVCRRLVQRWMSKDGRALREVVKQWVQEKWQELGLTADQLIGRYQRGCEEALGQAPESNFQAIYNNMAVVLKAGGAKTPTNGEAAPNLPCLVEAMNQLEEMVGIPEECRPTPPPGEPSSYQPGTLEASLKKAAAKIVDQSEQKMAELVVWLIEQPKYRLAGAEEALRQLHASIEQALQTHEQLAQELQQRSLQVFQRIQKLLETPSTATPAPSLWWNSFSRRPPGGPSPAIAELRELLRSYPKCRYQSMIMQHVTALYVSLRGLLSDQLREVDYCRARLGELVGMLGDSANDRADAEAPASGRYLFAEGCPSLDDAVRKLESGVGPAELVELDGRMQALIRKKFKALVHVCMTSANVLKLLAPAMEKEARSYLRSRLADKNVVDIYLGQFGDDGEKQAEINLAKAFERSAPEVISSSPARELNILAVPLGPTERRLRELVKSATEGQSWVAVRSAEEIVMYREHTIGCLADLKQLGPLGQEAYQKLIAQEHFTPHSRNDIVEWGKR